MCIRDSVSGVVSEVSVTQDRYFQREISESSDEGDEWGQIQVNLKRLRWVQRKQIKLDTEQPNTPMSLFNHNSIWLPSHDSKKNLERHTKCFSIDFEGFSRIQFEKQPPSLIIDFVTKLLGYDYQIDVCKAKMASIVSGKLGTREYFDTYNPDSLEYLKIARKFYPK